MRSRDPRCLGGCTTAFDFVYAVACPPGTYERATVCYDCPRGTYNNESNQDSCTPCPTGTSVPRSTSVTDCRGTGFPLPSHSFLILSLSSCFDALKQNVFTNRMCLQMVLLVTIFRTTAAVLCHTPVPELCRWILHRRKWPPYPPDHLGS